MELSNTWELTPLNQEPPLKDTWDYAQERVEIRPYTPLYQLDAEEQQTLQDFLNGDQVEVYCELNDDEDYGVMHGDGKIARVSSCITINGVRWHLVPGKNIVPRPVYEFMQNAKVAAATLPTLQPNRAGNLGLFRSSKSA